MAQPLSPTYVQVQPNSTGEPIDVVLVDYQPLNPNNLVVGRQVLATGDPNNALAVGTVTAAGEVVNLDIQVRDTLSAILVQLEITNQLLNKNMGFGLNLDLDALAVQLSSLKKLDPRI